METPLDISKITNTEGLKLGETNIETIEYFRDKFLYSLNTTKHDRVAFERSLRQYQLIVDADIIYHIVRSYPEYFAEHPELVEKNELYKKITTKHGECGSLD